MCVCVLGCLQPFHAGAAVPATPVALLRTRFSAYCKGLGDYVVKTTHADNEVLKEGSRTKDGVVVSTLAADVAASASKLRFSDLEVLGQSQGTAPDQAIVAFRYKVRAGCVLRLPWSAVVTHTMHTRTQVVVVGQTGFGGRSSAKELVTESSVFLRDAPDGPWRFLSSTTKTEVLKV
jgi:uncharacterized protein YchJ